MRSNSSLRLLTALDYIRESKEDEKRGSAGE